MASVSSEQAIIYKFGTSGYRSDKEEGFNEAVVTQIAVAISDYLIQNCVKQGETPGILIGGDTREKTRKFIPVITQLLIDRGWDVYQADGDVPTPVLAYAAKYFSELGFASKTCAGAILMTASHNPWPYGGFNFLTPDGAIVPGVVSKQFEQLQAGPKNLSIDRQALGITQHPKVHLFDPYPIYQKHLKQGLKLRYDLMKQNKLCIFYDPLYATGRKYLPRLLESEGITVAAIHDTDERPADYTGMPEPSPENMAEIRDIMLAAPGTTPLTLAFANDGDADRFGVVDEQGNFVSPNDVLLAVLHHLTQNRKEQGVLVRSQATSLALDEMAEKHGIAVQQTPVGYKYIAEEFIEHEEKAHEIKGSPQVLLGGESSGGLSVIHHIPEKDGLLANLMIAELVAVENKPLSEILEGLKSELSKKYVNHEWAIKTDQGPAVGQFLKDLETSNAAEFLGLPLDMATTRTEGEKLQSKYGTRDGMKLYFQGGGWLLQRSSGTEPLVRIYLETVGDTLQAAETKAQKTIDQLMALLTAQFGIPASAIKAK